MIDEQLELDGYLFGAGCPWQLAGWGLGDRSLLTQDFVDPVGDGRAMGRDREDAPEWSFLLRTRGRPDPLAEVGRLRSAWEGPRSTVRGLSVLRYRVMGRTRRVYGRPRRFAPLSDPLTRAVGMAEVDATFQLADPYHYDDDLNSVTYSGVAPPGGNLSWPITFPWSSEPSGESSARFVKVQGDAPAPLAIRFSGPVVRPRVWTADGRIDVRLTGELAYDQQVTVDARQGTVLRQDGASVPGMLSPRTRMADLVLPPGTHEIFYAGGSDSSVTIAWRNAWRSI